ncbi:MULTISPECIES: ArnT family glycosyltransferase [unclassified Coleofasciculus]|uniref:ArnT family glycosyltransferase n=1 Tax=unclassified Coleofasciculus TaxID=2692782 RepID=UPI00188016B3|nr:MULTISPECIES: glycosyltransferase family 39 protein [unclassified Coleofasciculus]MBE9129623.1 glycosyltransferase family 39 protein [Coleofasciculus sp. LEGE 07081]MBE9149805.1 glycosyltransferase family 39 protein [Coleofasciculus sp. LEGE 07092]
MNVRVASTLTNWWTSWEKRPSRIWMLSIVWLLAISWVAFLWHLGSTGLVDETEPLFAEAARQMTVTGDWITPYFNGDTRFDKPPLIYWLMAIGYNLIGVNEWAVRLPSAISAIALTGLAFYTLRYFGVSRPSSLTLSVNAGLEDNAKRPTLERQRWLSAWIGAALIALNPQTIIWARIGVSDMLLSGCMGTALLAFFLGYAQGERNQKNLSAWYLAFYILIGLAVLAKGPIGIVLPGLIIGSFGLYLGNLWQILREMWFFLGSILVLALALPWYVLVTLANGSEFIDSFFGYHNIARFTTVVKDYDHSQPWYFYILVVLVGFVPWSCYLPVAIARLRFWQRNRWRSSPRSAQLGLFALFWFAGIFGFFTIAMTKLPSYVLPLIPAAAILVALLGSDLCTSISKGQKRQPLFLVCGVINVLLSLVLAGAIFYSPDIIGYDPAAPNLTERLQASGLPLRGGAIWGATAVAAAIALLKQRWWRWLGVVNLIGFVAFLMVVVTPASFLMDEARQLPLRQLSAIAAQVERPGEELLMIGFKKPSVVFYSQRPVNYFDEDHKGIAYVEKKATTQPNPPSVLILLDSKKLNKFKEEWLKPNEYKTLSRAGAYELIRVAKQIVAKK